jgi:uncharacterized membrane protein
MQKEDVYAIAIFAAIGIAVPAVVVLRHFLGIDVVPFINPQSVRTVVGVLLAIVATLVCALNFYLYFISPWLYRRERGSMDDYHAMSGIPIVGGFFILGAGALMPESHVTGAFLIALYALDTNGVPWFFFQVLRGGGV